MTKRDHAGDVDLVAAKAIGGWDLDLWTSRDSFGSSCEGLGRCSCADRPVRADGVVVVPELIELDLQLPRAPDLRMLVEPPLERLVEPLDLAAGLRVLGTRGHVPDPERGGLELDRTESASGNRGEHSTVIGEQ